MTQYTQVLLWDSQESTVLIRERRLSLTSKSLLCVNKEVLTHHSQWCFVYLWKVCRCGFQIMSPENAISLYVNIRTHLVGNLTVQGPVVHQLTSIVVHKRVWLAFKLSVSQLTRRRNSDYSSENIVISPAMDFRCLHLHGIRDADVHGSQPFSCFW